MSIAMPEFLATCWTSGGDIMPARTGDYSPVPIERRVAAVAAAGFRGFGITHADLTVVRDGMGYHALGQLFAEHGIRYVELEYIDDWWCTGPRRTASDRMRADLFEAARALGARHIKAGLGATGDEFDRDVVYSAFDELAWEAHGAGTRIALEPAAFSMTPTITPAAEMVRELAHPSGGLLVDIWHIYRSGMSYDEMAAVLPAEYVFAVELNDGWPEPRGTLYEDTFDNRQLCGEGEFGVADFIRSIDGIGYSGPWGLEQMSISYRRLTPEDGTRSVIDAARRLFASIGGERPEA